MSSNTIKLFKLASEINIGKDAIVDFLQSKGYDIENRPTANLTDDMVEAVYEKFKREKKAIENQRAKLEKHKLIRRGPESKHKAEQDAIPFQQADDTTENISDVESDKEFKEEETISAEIPSEIISEAKQEIDSSKTVPVEISKPIVEPVSEIKITPPEEVYESPKVGDKIDLNKLFGKPAYKKPEEKVIEKKVEAKVETKTPDIIEAKVEEKPTTKPEAIDSTIATTVEQKEAIKAPQVDLIQPVETIVAIEQEPKEIIADNTALSDEELASGDDLLDSDKKKDKKRKKHKKLIEIDYHDDAPKLKGLTIVGKIDLQKDKPIKKDKKEIKKKVLDEEEDDVAGKFKAGKAKKRPKPGKVKDVSFDKAADKKKKKKKNTRETFSSEEIDKAVRKTLAGMEEASALNMRQKLRMKRREEREEKELKKSEEKIRESKILNLTEFVTTNDLANIMNVSSSDVILKCLHLGLMVTINQRLDKDTITLIADDYGFQVEFHDEKMIQAEEFDEDPPESLLPRHPIVTIMGHVDHGKTSLLDYIRSSNIIAGEAGGITQHIGAYAVRLPSGKRITFLDTPGHEAFTAMRARGAQVTDIVILVVAADDSVMPQTVEAISHAQAAHVPIVVAINKCDKPDANPTRIKQQLTDQGILVEDWGGKYQSVEISAKKGINVDLLLEKILLEAELLEIKANPNRRARCVVIEANMDKGHGAISTIIVKKGTLKVGDPFICGIHYGKVRAMLDERGNKVEEATPGMPVRVTGFDGLPEAGDIFVVTATEIEARAIASQRQQLRREQEFRQVRLVTLDDISKQIQVGGIKELNLIIKADVSGSLEALSDSLLKISTDEVRVIILHKGVGSINESDVMLAIASNAVVIGFQISTTLKAKKLAEKEAVDIRNYNIIYDCINEVRLALEGLLTPDMKEDVTAQVEIRQIFKISRLGAIAGSYVLSGKITRNDRVRLLRDGLPIFTGTLRSLKRNKDDVREVDTGYECGVMLDGFNDLQVGDIVECFKVVEVMRTLQY